MIYRPESELRATNLEAVLAGYFEQPGTLDIVVQRATRWFRTYLAGLAKEP